MKKKIAILGFLMLASVAMAYIVSASDALKGLARGVFGSNEVTLDADLIYTNLSPDQKAKAVEIALDHPQVQAKLEGVDNYSATVSNVYDMQEINFAGNERGIALIPRDGFALVEFLTYRDYGEEVGVKVVKATINLLEEEVTEIEEFPEIRKPKVLEGTISVDELLSNPSSYQGQVVRVSGTVSDLGLLKGPYFKLDEKLLICYLYGETNIYPTQIKDKIQNGDRVIVTGRFLGDMLYAEKVEKVTS
jgi:hypothetical protein